MKSNNRMYLHSLTCSKKVSNCQGLKRVFIVFFLYHFDGCLPRGDIDITEEILGSVSPVPHFAIQGHKTIARIKGPGYDHLRW